MSRPPRNGQGHLAAQAVQILVGGGGQTQLAAASRGLQRQEQAQTVLIENTGACSAYVYAPYALSALPQEGALRTDSLESTQLPASGLRGARQYRFTMPLAPEQTAAELLDALREQPEKADAYLSAEGSYRAFVQEQDVTLPAQIRAQLFHRQVALRVMLPDILLGRFHRLMRFGKSGWVQNDIVVRVSGESRKQVKYIGGFKA